jgi:hypothetical protein
MQNKRGAIDLSIGTVVIVVIAVMVLIIGISIVSKLGCSAIRGIDTLNDATVNEIYDKFSDGSKIVVKEPKNEIRKGVDYNIALGIQDSESRQSSYSYSIEASDLGTCKFSKEVADSFIILGRTSENFGIDEKVALMVVFSIPTTTENCVLKYKISATKDNEFYDAKEFQVSILNKGIMKSFC